MVFSVKFWGVRGSIACCAADFIRYGGNTSCIEVNVDDRFFVLDAGTGIRPLGLKFLKEGVREAHLLLSHTHWDHINGFPFFQPAYDSTRTIHVLGGHLMDQGGVRNVLSSQMISPLFPVPLDAMRANMRFDDFNAGITFDLYPDVRVRTAPLNHPNRATGYRIEYGGRSLCYVTDTEHIPGSPDQNILALIEGADLVIYDSTYTEQEFTAKIGWGHSTWNEGVKLCQAANVKQLALFHHEPDHNDGFMHNIEKEAKKKWSNAFAAREGMVVTLE